ncbi:pyridoxal 5'-phosphate synthase glutaminase subunit PdxT [Embleya scabrispora]|uniref:Pyridoxal 5'-phosphate synthase subunit PdxT n=1 Tax=Embleya scabrispora TaxID=159449 RepID=A0A1T3NU11_9ACTN|nr:pyridoxal 5'-phosphate synthase glutaminase subunit PdxT [Embleya scabrispora]OPC80180.1 pyridoxal 5'-phosphate synthase glutaminase subunit PdxT [Embleya scabrispora]
MSTTPIIGVLALQGDVREHAIALAELDAIARPVRKVEEFADLDALVIPGGESTTMSKLAVSFGLFPALRARVAEGMPVYGSCAGMIMLADKILDGREDQETVGGIDMIVRRNAFGRQNDSFEADVPFAGLEGDDPIHGVFIRAPWVESVGAEVEVLARLSAEPYADRIVAVRQGNLLATSFHPELTPDRRVHAYFVDMVRATL